MNVTDELLPARELFERIDAEVARSNEVIQRVQARRE